MSAQADVFLNFTSQDACGFARNLVAAFRRKRIVVFEDATTSGGAEDTFKRVREAIQNAYAFIIILSENYTSSIKCLEELVEIHECKTRKNGILCLPVFYGAKRNEVEKFIGSFGTASKELEASGNGAWKAALDHLFMKSGIEFELDHIRHELKIAHEIVGEVCERLPFLASDGMNAQVERILSLLHVDLEDDVRCIGIWGMSGIGKTRIAERTFRRISNLFEVRYFRQDLGKELHRKEPYSLLDDFLSAMVGGEFTRSAFTIKLRFIENQLQNKRILIVLDDVDCFRDVEHLVGIFDALGPGSRVIITSRIRDVLAQCMVNEIHEMEKLDANESLQLLSLYAFGKDKIEEKYLEPSIGMVTYAYGNPLALEVCGSLLRGRPVKDWDVSLLNFRQPESFEFLNALRRSYDLLDKNEKKIFLDLACFFDGMNKDHVADLLDGCGFFADIGINVLVNKSLVTVQENRVQMHYFIKEMGREIVHWESREPQWRSRLWNAEDIASILWENNGTEATEGVFLDMSNLCINLSLSAFQKMYRLRLLKIYCSVPEMLRNLSLPQGLHCLPRQLRFLHWECYPLGSLPPSFDPENLVELNLPYSSIEKLWEGMKNLKKLKRMSLSHSRCLIEIPSLSKASNLEYLDLEGCIGLVDLDSSINGLNKLVILNAQDCLKLKCFPSMVLLERLKVLNLSGCSQLENFPMLPQNLKELYLGGTELRHVPSSIENVTDLVRLDLENCRSLEMVPSNICKLKFLTFLNLSGCSILESFPEVSETMLSLRHLDLTKTLIKELPLSILSSVALEEIRWDKGANLSMLPESLRMKVKFNEGLAETLPLFHLESLSFLESSPYCVVELRLQNVHIREVPEEICQLASLEILDLSRNDFEKLPGSIKQLWRLQELKTSYCIRFKSLPVLPENLDHLDAHGCRSLRSYPVDAGPSFFFFLSSINVFPKVTEDVKILLPYIFTNAMKRAPELGKQRQKGLLEPPLLTICVPARAFSALLSLPLRDNRFSFQQSTSPWGLAFFFTVVFEKEHCVGAGFAIRCQYKLKQVNRESITVEKIFYCWSEDTDEHVLRDSHMCIFYDDSLHKYLVENGYSNTQISFSFYPVDLENKLLSSCSVKGSVYMLKTIPEFAKILRSSSWSSYLKLKAIPGEEQTRFLQIKRRRKDSLAEAVLLPSFEERISAPDEFESTFPCVSWDDFQGGSSEAQNQSDKLSPMPPLSPVDSDITTEASSKRKVTSPSWRRLRLLLRAVMRLRFAQRDRLYRHRSQRYSPLF